MATVIAMARDFSFNVVLRMLKFLLKTGYETLRALPDLVALRRRRAAKVEPVILLFSEFGDEINGIAQSTRELVRVLHGLHRDAFYVTMAHSTRNRLEWEMPAVCVVPQAASLDTPGYPGVEMAFPRLRPLLKIIRDRNVTHVDILTPGLGCLMMAPLFRFAGIPISSQYRTDIFAYGRHMGLPRIVMAACHAVLGVFFKASRLVGVPSAAYGAVLTRRYPGIAGKVAVLERGLPVRFDDLRKRVEARRDRYVAAGRTGARRFFFLGRISKEKNLALLAAVWKSDPALRGVPLTFFGEGAYRKELARAFADHPEVTFAGPIAAEDLPERMCEMDFLVFPSGTDTFGQAVLESLCMGIPALVGDRGGPAELIAGRGNGFVLPHDDQESWSSCIKRCAAMGGEEYGRMSRRAREEALARDPVASAERHWKHWLAAGSAAPVDPRE
jgi:glycosyltransferase involved in cell wall biosynthesis